MTPALHALPAVDLARLIRAREVTSLEVVEASLARIAAVNPALNAVIQLRAEGAIADARAADRGLATGDALVPLHGVPFTAKDWIDTCDLPTSAGMPDHRDRLPGHDATAVARVRAAGAILLGKTKAGVEDDLYPRAANPFDLTRTPGGSSAGEAAIIAAGGSPLGLGSDSGGSLRWPAHCCGIAAIKPTTGLVPLTGHFPRIIAMSDPRTVIGPMARSVEDLALTLRVMAGPDGRDPSCVPVPVQEPGEYPIRGLRVAWYTDMPGATAPATTVDAVRFAANALESAGAVVEKAVPQRLEEALTITEAYWSRPESMEMSRWSPPRSSTLTADEVEESLFQWDRFRRSMLEFFANYDLIVCPVAEAPAPLLSEPVTGETYRYMLPYSLTGNPVVVVRAGTDAGLPLGVQIVGRNWEDATAMAAAAAVERALGPWDWPALPA